MAMDFFFVRHLWLDMSFDGRTSSLPIAATWLRSSTQGQVRGIAPDYQDFVFWLIASSI